MSQVISIAKLFTFHFQIILKNSNKEKHIGQTLCTGNYSTHDGLVNGANGIFQALNKLHNSLKVIWILFNNPKSGQLT
jgi:hypothetical protein